MTEAQWQGGTDPVPMVEFLRGRASDRKLRLFVVACSRLEDDRSPTIVSMFEAAERLADGRATREEVRRLWLHPPTVNDYAWPERPFEWASSYVGLCPKGEATQEEQEGSPPAALLPPLLREVFGNPFRPPPQVQPAWLAWEGDLVRKLAQAVYDEGAFERLPILADALEEAGCAEAELLGHLRAAGPHVRGCWALDLLLGKQ
jgi:hypothetical protein